MKKSNAIILAIVLLIHVVGGIIMMWWTDRNLDWLATSIKGVETDVPLWISALSSIFLWEFTFVFNIIVSIIKAIF